MKDSRVARRARAGLRGALALVLLAALTSTALAITPKSGSFVGRTKQLHRMEFTVKAGSNQLRAGTVRKVQTLVRTRCADGITRTRQVTPRQSYAVRNARFKGHGVLDGGWEYEISGRFLRQDNAQGTLTLRGPVADGRCRGTVGWTVNKTP
jgi:hypothetical protein